MDRNLKAIIFKDDDIECPMDEEFSGPLSHPRYLKRVPVEYSVAGVYAIALNNIYADYGAPYLRLSNMRFGGLDFPYDPCTLHPLAYDPNNGIRSPMDSCSYPLVAFNDVMGLFFPDEKIHDTCPVLLMSERTYYLLAGRSNVTKIENGIIIPIKEEIYHLERLDALPCSKEAQNGISNPIKGLANLLRRMKV